MPFLSNLNFDGYIIREMGRYYIYVYIPRETVTTTGIVPVSPDALWDADHASIQILFLGLVAIDLSHLAILGDYSYVPLIRWT